MELRGGAEVETAHWSQGDFKASAQGVAPGVGGGGDGEAKGHPSQRDRERSSCTQDTDQLLLTASDDPVGRNQRKTHKGMNEGLQEVLGGGSVKSVDRVLLWG